MFNRCLLGIMLIVTIAAQAQSLSALQWLEGNWLRKGTKAIGIESWVVVDDSTMHGMAYRVKGMDTILTESIRLVFRNQQIYYIPTVTDQNNGLPVTFLLVSESVGCILFENAEHDFPKKITYCNVSPKEMQVVIAGDVEGVEKVITFHFIRAAD